MLARVLVLGIPAPWRDIHFPVRLEVRHVILHIVKRCSACEATPVHLPVGRPKNDVLRIGTTDHGPEQLVEFRFVGHERIAPKTESARLVEQNQAEAFHVNHQWKFPNVRFRVATRTSRESGMSMRIQDEAISRWQGADPIRPVCGSSQVSLDPHAKAAVRTRISVGC